MRGSSKGSEGRVVQVYRKKWVIHVDRVTRDKSNGSTVQLPVHPSNVVITKIKLDKDRCVAPCLCVCVGLTLTSSTARRSSRGSPARRSRLRRRHKRHLACPFCTHYRPDGPAWPAPGARRTAHARRVAVVHLQHATHQKAGEGRCPNVRMRFLRSARPCGFFRALFKCGHAITAYEPAFN